MNHGIYKALLWILIGVFCLHIIVSRSDHSVYKIFKQLSAHDSSLVKNLSKPKTSYNTRPTHITRLMSMSSQLKSTYINKINDTTTSQCQIKRTNVVFLKVHKCGSSTVSNIFQRFTLRNDLNGVYPNKSIFKRSFWIFSRFRKQYMSQIIPIPTNEQYNTMFVHTVHDRDIFKRLFPNNTFYTAIIRDPVERFVSYSFYYGEVKRIIKNYTNIDEQSPYVYSKVLTMDPLPFFSHLYGPSYDLGYNISSEFDISKVNQFIENINADYDFIMIMEYFDESLIYLRRQLCWGLFDILYVKRNVNRFKRNYALSPKDRQMIKDLQPVDTILFDYFYDKFWNILKNQPINFFQEVIYFKKILREVSDFCYFRDTSGELFIIIETTEWNPTFQVTIRDCEQMEWPERKAIHVLSDKARDKYNRSLNKQGK